jgi:hypothetical protein
MITLSVLPLLAATTLSPTDETILELRVISVAFESLIDSETRLGVEPGAMTTAHRAVAAFPPEVLRWLPTRDGWGRPIRVLIGADDATVLISFGADGSADRDYVKIFSNDNASADWLRDAERGKDDDIVFVGGVIAPDLPSPVEEAMTYIRVIGTAMEAYAVDNDTYPEAAGLVPIEALAPQLLPVYIRELPGSDPWGHPYFVSSSSEGYVIVSTGADGLLDAPLTDAKSASATIELTTNDEADIVFANGAFTKYPGVVPPN